jgi:dienelactone hydrolase
VNRRAVGLASLASLLALSGVGRAQAAPFAIGVSSELVGDGGRRSAGQTSPRAVQITVWYPARPDTAAPVTYGDYFDLAQAERGTPADSVRHAARAGFASFLAKRGVSDSAMARWLAMPMRAVRGASPLGPRFPLIVIVQGNGQSAGEQSMLAEYLASGGSVVATSPSYTRISGPPASESDLGTGAEEQADDIAFVVAALRRRSDVDSAQLGVVAHSLGARGALLYVMRNRSAQALVSLDGGIGTATGRSAMETAPSFARRRLETPILHFYETLDSFMSPDFGLLASLSGAPITVAQVPAMHHHHFTDLGGWIARVPGLTEATGATEATASAHRMMWDVTRAFLDSHVRGDARAFPAAQAAASRTDGSQPNVQFAVITGGLTP